MLPAQEIATTIKGVALDVENREPVAFASVLLNNGDSKHSALADENGRFSFTVGNLAIDATLRISAVGYKTELMPLNGVQPLLLVQMRPQSFVLKDFVVTAKGYRNKNNPAVDLIRKVIEHKAANRPENNAFVSCEKYDKMLFSLNGITPRFKRRKFLKNFRFAFEHIDTLHGQEMLPLFLRETLADVHYRKSPRKNTEIIKANKSVEIRKYIDNEGIQEYMKNMYQPIDIYAENINFLTRQFLCPLSEAAPAFYRFFIADSIAVGGDTCVQVLFTPRFKEDMLFEGKLFVATDGSYAVRRVELSLDDNINLNWVKDAQIVLEFEKSPSGVWLPSFSEEEVDFRLAKSNKMGVLGQHRVSFGNYSLDAPAEAIFEGQPLSEIDSASLRNEDYWQANRHEPLGAKAEHTYSLADSIQRVPTFRRTASFLNLLVSDYLDLGYFEIGAFTTFYGNNPVEDSWVRLGGRTTPELSKRFFFEGDLKYGFGDNRLKGYAGATWAFSWSAWAFPVKSIFASYKYETWIPGTDYEFTPEDKVFLAFTRASDNKRVYNKTLRIEHLNEFNNHFSYTAGFIFQEQNPAGKLFFNNIDYNQQQNTLLTLNRSEFYLKLRYAPDEKIYIGRSYRRRIPSKSPVFTLQYNVGSPLWGNNYSYHNVWLMIEKRFYLSILGYSDIALEADRLFGRVPFPLLNIHRGNQTYSNQLRGYNQMNWLEFVSDQYVALFWEHCFDGFLLNKIPLIRQLKLREFIGCKVLWGSMSRQNDPSYNRDLLRFPTNADGVPTMYALDPKIPYVEANIGIGNILKLFRVDLVKRFTYLRQPDVSEYGVRMRLRVDF